MKESVLNNQDVRDTKQLIKDIETQISRIELLRTRIALSLLLTEVLPQWGRTSGR